MAKRIITPFAEAGDRTAMPDSPSGTDSNYQTGYPAAYEADPVSDPDARFVERDKTNQLYNDITSNIKEWQEKSFPAFITSANNGGSPFPYGKGAIVSFSGKNYISVTDGNVSTPPSGGWGLFLGDLTTEDLINSSVDYDSDEVINTIGFYSAGVGAGAWKQNGVIGQPPSKSPSDLVQPMLNDANGNQWFLVIGDGFVNTPEKLGAKGDGSHDDTLPIKAAAKNLTNGFYGLDVIFTKGKRYTFEGYDINGDVYESYTKSDIKSRFSQDEFDFHTREYMDSNLYIWRLKLRAGRETLPNNTRVFDKAQFDAAINSGTVKITFVGTSITRGENAQAERLNNWVQMFLEELKIKYPTVDIIFRNLGIDGRRIDQYVDPTYQGQASMPANPEDGWFYAASNDSWQDGTTVGKSWEDHAKDTAPDMLVINFGMNDGVDDDQTFSDNLQTVITNAKGWTTPPTIALVSEVSPNQDEVSVYSSIRKFSRLTRFTANKEGYGLLDAGRFQRYAEGGIDDTRSAFKRIDSAVGISDWRFSFSAPTTQGVNSLSKSNSTPSVVIKDGEYNSVRTTFTFAPSGVGGQFFVVMGTDNNAQQYNTDAINVWRETTNIRVMTRPGFASLTVPVPNDVASGTPEEIDVRIVNNHVIVFIDNVKYVDFFVNDNGADGGVGIGIANGINTNIVLDIGAPYQLSAPLLDKRGLYGELGGGVQGDGGNGINHPARLAYEYVWRPAVSEFISQL